MYTEKKLQEFEEKIKVCYRGNPLWQIVVLNQQWLCPFCGDIGATVGSEEKMVSQILKHFITVCKDWKEFRGKPISMSDLKEKTVGLEVASLMKYEPLWQCFDYSGRWYCPYCAMAVPTEYTKEKSITPVILTAAKKHLLSCAPYLEGGKKPLNKEDLLKIVQHARLMDMLSNNLRAYAISGDKRWFLSDTNGKWRCPFCMTVYDSIDISVPILRTETAPKLMSHHLIFNCVPFQKAQKIKELVEASMPKETTSTYQGQVKKINGIDICILSPKGDIDYNSFPAFEGTLKHIIDKGFSWILINFSEVKYINSTALGILIKTLDTCKERGGALLFSNLPEKLVVVLNTLSLDTVFKIFPDEEKALASI